MLTTQSRTSMTCSNKTCIIQQEAKLKAKAEATKEQSGSNADGSGQEEQGTKLQGDYLKRGSK